MVIKTDARNQTIRLVLTIAGLCALPCEPCAALKVGPNKAKMEAEAELIQQMVSLTDSNGLIGMLSTGEFPSKVTAALCLGELGDDRALPELMRLNTSNGGWVIRFLDEDHDGAFAVAVCRILTRDLPESEQVKALLELLDGRGPAVPESIEPFRMTLNGVPREMPRRLDMNRAVARRVADELEKFDDPSIVARLRRSENHGISPYALWREVRDMEVETAVARCLQVARDEGGAQRYGAIHCLEKFGAEGVDALDQLALEGHAEAIVALSGRENDPQIFDLLCWHVTSNQNYWPRSRAVDAVAYVNDDSLEVQSLRTLVQALYDPSRTIRQKAATALLNRAYKHNKRYFDQIEDSLLIALRHPDSEVCERVLKALERLGCQRLGTIVPESPPIRTDLEESSPLPTTAEQRLKAKVDPLEKQAAKALKLGPPEKALELYGELLTLKPGFEPYQRALELAKAYVAAAARATDPWLPDAPYIGLKGRYYHALACTQYNAAHLKEVLELEAELLKGFGTWARPFTRSPESDDLNVKRLRLYEHVVDHYAENEHSAIRAKLDSAELRRRLYKDSRTGLLRRLDIYMIPAEQVVCSIDETSNTPIAEHGGRTRTQLAFERYKEQHRRSIIDACKYDRTWRHLLDTIVEKCARTDPKIVEMAKAAKIEISQSEQFRREEREQSLRGRNAAN